MKCYCCSIKTRSFEVRKCEKSRIIKCKSNTVRPRLIEGNSTEPALFTKKKSGNDKKINCTSTVQKNPLNQMKKKIIILQDIQYKYSLVESNLLLLPPPIEIITEKPNTPDDPIKFVPSIILLCGKCPGDDCPVLFVPAHVSRDWGNPKDPRRSVCGRDADDGPVVGGQNLETSEFCRH